MIAHLILRRIEQNDQATFGTLTDDEEKPLAVTLEPPWRDNQPDVSCIPAGTYHGMLTASPHLGYVTPELFNVPGRSDIRLHIGNTVRDTEGCILIGTSFGTVEGLHGITQSANAFHALMGAINGAVGITLHILDVPPDPQ